jgi:DNA-binding IclR family transcriptional regulator
MMMIVPTAISCQSGLIPSRFSPLRMLAMINTITDPDALRRHLAEIKERGYAFDCEEHNVGVYCLASPIAVRSEVVGAIGVTGRSKEALKPHIQTVQHIAEVISHILSRGS